MTTTTVRTTSNTPETIRRPLWLDIIDPYGPSCLLTAAVVTSSQRSTAAGTIGGQPATSPCACAPAASPARLTAVTVNGRTAFVNIAASADGRYRVDILRVAAALGFKPGMCLHLR